MILGNMQVLLEGGGWPYDFQALLPTSTILSLYDSVVLLSHVVYLGTSLAFLFS